MKPVEEAPPAVPDAIVLAGGLGTRLRAEVPEVPKPLAPVAGRPFLAWVLDHLAARGVRHAVLSVGDRHGAIQHHFGDTFAGRIGPLALAYCVEERPLGTGGAIRAALGACATDPVLVVNGDTLFDIDLNALLARHRSAGRPLTMALHRVPDTARYGRVGVTDGIVTGFDEKGTQGPGPINAGLYVVSARLFEGFDLPAAFSFEHDLLAPHLAALAPAAHEADGYFIDIGVPADYRRARAELAAW